MTDLEALISLNMVSDIGSIRLKKLLERFGSPKKILSASTSELKRVEGIGEKIASGIILAKNEVNLKREFELIKKYKATVISLNDEAYPSNLKNIYDPPIILYIKGELLGEDSQAVAIVGSRRASFYGLSTAERFGYQLASLGLTVVSGMARGVDTASHKGALKAKGRTLAVWGSGLACVYPPENRNLADEISQNGALLSEFPMQTKPLAQNFPRRNRVISGLSLGTVVVEASRNSGALITADFALNEGREVFSVPGKLDSVTSWGTNRLIKQGAKLIENIEDIIEELRLPLTQQLLASSQSSSRPNTLKEEERLVYNVVSFEPKHIDELANLLRLPVSNLNPILLSLELRHLVRQLPGKRFVRTQI